MLRGLRARGSRALIFTQMARMLDILEAWLNLHAFTYLRLDGSTKPEQRQALMQRFNTSPKVLVFILSTRSGGARSPCDLKKSSWCRACALWDVNHRGCQGGVEAAG